MIVALALLLLIVLGGLVELCLVTLGDNGETVLEWFHIGRLERVEKRANKVGL